MIVVSGVLVLVALVLLIIGLLQEGLFLVYVSIGTSVLAGVFLLLGALQRRGQPALADAGAGTAAPDRLDGVTTVTTVRADAGARDAAPVSESAAAPSASAGEVLIVPGRPRYHVAGCRFLAGRDDTEGISLADAKAQSYTACGVCKPDDAVAAAAPTDEAPARRPASKAAARPAAKPAAKRAAASAGGAARTAAKTTAKKAATTAAKPAAKKTASKPAAKAPAKKAAAKAPAKAAATKSPAKKAPAKKAPAKKATTRKAAGKG